MELIKKRFKQKEEESEHYKSNVNITQAPTL